MTDTLFSNIFLRSWLCKNGLVPNVSPACDLVGCCHFFVQHIGRLWYILGDYKTSSSLFLMITLQEELYSFKSRLDMAWSKNAPCPFPLMQGHQTKSGSSYSKTDKALWGLRCLVGNCILETIRKISDTVYKSWGIVGLRALWKAFYEPT